MKILYFYLFAFMLGVPALAETPPYPTTWVFERYNILHTLKKSDKFVPLTSTENGTSHHSCAIRTLKDLMKKVSGKSDIYDLSGPDHLHFQWKGGCVFQGILSIAGASVLVPPTTEISITNELRLGLDSRTPYSELPRGHARLGHILPTSMDIHGIVRIALEKNAEAQVELDQTHLRIGEKGQILIGLPMASHFGWVSLKSRINAFESYISTQKINSQEDTFDIQGHVTFQADMANFNKASFVLGDIGSYFASELVARFNTTSLTLRGHVSLDGSFTFIMGFDKEAGATFPTVCFDNTPDFSNVLAKVEMTILELYKSPIGAHFKNHLFPLFICSKGFKNIPKLELVNLKNEGFEGELLLSEDKKLILLSFK